MRTLAIGDIHGCSRALEALLDAVAPSTDDHVITLGDYVDRGPDTSGVIERLLALRSQCHLTALRGNHESMMLRSRTDLIERGIWMRVGGREALASYAEPGDIAAVPEHHWQFLDALPRWHETESGIFVHASVQPHLPMPRQRADDLIWGNLSDRSRGHVSGKLVVCGHTAQRNGQPLDLGHTICIDTYAYGGGWLTCLDVKTGHYWQANQDGERREGQR